MYIVQDYYTILIIKLLIILFCIISSLISYIFLKEKKENRPFKKSVIINSIFYVILYLTYYFVVEKNLHISIFSTNQVTEKTYLLLSFSLIYFACLGIQILVSKTISVLNTKNSFYVLIGVLNFLALLIFFLGFYPKSYVDKEIKNYERTLYLPNKANLKLLDNTFIKLDTACTSKNNYFNDRIEENIYNFRIKILKIGTDRYSYSFKILDDTIISGSEEQNNCKILEIKSIDDEIKVAFVQKNQNPNIGWKQEIITDTIVFKKIKTEIRKAGYYGDTDCDCIEH